MISEKEIEFFGILAMGIIIGILGTLLFLAEVRKNSFEINDDNEEDFESLEEIFSHSEDFIPEEEEIELPQYSGIKIPTGEDVKKHIKAMEDLKNGNEEK